MGLWQSGPGILPQICSGSTPNSIQFPPFPRPDTTPLGLFVCSPGRANISLSTFVRHRAAPVFSDRPLQPAHANSARSANKRRKMRKGQYSPILPSIEVNVTKETGALATCWELKPEAEPRRWTLASCFPGADPRCSSLDRANSQSLNSADLSRWAKAVF